MTALWTAGEAAAATGGVNTAPWNASGVSIDSRSLRKDDLFVAIKGPNTDGHEHIAGAIENGAAAVMAAKDAATGPHGAPVLAVDDTMGGIRALAAHARARGGARIAAVTGSTGKTGTKDALNLALGRQAPSYATEGNLNNNYGLPLSLARLPRDARFGVFELGMNSPGEIAPLSQLARPDVAIVTNVDAVHLAFFESEEQIADAKAEIFTGMDGAGTALLNRDNRHFERLRDHAVKAGVGRVLSFGKNERADIRLIEATLQSSRSLVAASIDGTPVSYTLGAPGAHWVINSLAVLAAVDALGGDLSEAARAMADVSPAPGRGARLQIRLGAETFLLIDESYNASPASMRAALDVLGATETPGRRIAVLGDMLELGSRSPALHAALADDIARNNVDLVFLAGRDMASLADALDASAVAGHGDTSEAVLPRVIEAVRPGDTVMVKGSLGSRMAPIVAGLRAIDNSNPGCATPRAANGG